MQELLHESDTAKYIDLAKSLNTEGVGALWCASARAGGVDFQACSIGHAKGRRCSRSSSVTRFNVVTRQADFSLGDRPRARQSAGQGVCFLLIE
jgi:hypothetical protein